MSPEDRAIENGGRDAHAWGDEGFGQGGLTKREYIATMAMQGLVASESEGAHFESLADLAGNAVHQADELLLALERIPDQGRDPNAEHAPHGTDVLP